MVVTVLIICGDRVWLGVGTQRHEERRKTAAGTSTAAARPSIAPAPFNYSRLGRGKAQEPWQHFPCVQEADASSSLGKMSKPE